MYIKKRICDNLLGTLLNLEEKSKDNLKARQDLQAMHIRPDLQPVLLPNGRYHVRPTLYNLSVDENLIAESLEALEGARWIYKQYL